MRSDIFDSYAKIAEEKGLIKLADDSKALKKYKTDVYPRIGSDDISTIEALYGVKPDSSITYKHNIMEAAHPNAVVVCPSYDKINGLVENEIERQNIDINIVMGPTTGKNVTQGPKYARKQLMLELVRIANDMDNANVDGLRILADDCIVGLKKKINKTAFLPLIIAAGAILAGVWLWSHMDDPDKGLMANIDNALKELDDLKTNSWYESSVDATVQGEADNIEKHLNTLKQYVMKFSAVMSQVEKPRSLTDMGEVEKLKDSAEKYGANVNAVMESFRGAVEEVTPLLAAAIKNFSDRQYQLSHTENSWVGDVSGWLGEAFHGRYGLVANDFVSAVNALDTLRDSLMAAYRMAGSIESIKQQKQEEAANALASLKSEKPSWSASQVKPGENGEEKPYGHEEPAFDNMQSGNYVDFAKALGRDPSDKEKAFLQFLMNDGA